jgi:tRNA modification GTPase
MAKSGNAAANSRASTVLHTDDTIAALASAAGGAVRGIVRLSGPALIDVVRSCFVANDGTSLCSIRSPRVVSGRLPSVAAARGQLPADLYFWPDARSYTRQPLAEIHTLGSPPLLAATLRCVCAAGARLAEPGEFTQRAFLAGRIDLAQAEAVLGVIDARGDADFRRALGQLAGGLSRPLDRVRDQLLDLTAHLEAGLDFVEDDIAFITAEQVRAALQEARATVEQSLAQLSARNHHDQPLRAVLVGLPNVGKSSLFNALAPDAAALISNQPGTTRDYLIATLELGAVRVQLVDTAGRMAAADRVASASQQVAADLAAAAELRLLCLDATRPLTAWEQAQRATGPEGSLLEVWTKCDQGFGPSAAHPGAIATSSIRGQGLDRLKGELSRRAADLARDEATVSMTAERCGQSLRGAAERLAQAAELNRTRAGEELVVAEIRLALAEVGRVVGAVYTDDILDRVFSRFCIGK